MAYPDGVDKFTPKLDKRQDDDFYSVEEEIELEGGRFEGYLGHDNIVNDTIRVFSGPNLTGIEITDWILSIPADAPWRRIIRIFAPYDRVYVSYLTPGDTVDAADVNELQDSITRTQTDILDFKNDYQQDISNINDQINTLENSKADKTYVDNELTQKADKTYVDNELAQKADKADTYTKTETDNLVSQAEQNAKSYTDQQIAAIPDPHWDDVQGKPGQFPPADHTHSANDITSGTIATARLPAASTSSPGIVQLNNTTNSTSTTQAATANAVKQAYDLANSKLSPGVTWDQLRGM